MEKDKEQCTICKKPITMKYKVCKECSDKHDEEIGKGRQANVKTAYEEGRNQVIKDVEKMIDFYMMKYKLMSGGEYWINGNELKQRLQELKHGNNTH